LISDNKNNNKLRALSVIVRVDKNCLHTGDKGIITIRVVDKHATNAVSAATVSCRLSSPSGPFKKLEGTANNKGKASYSWTVSDGDTLGKYKMSIEVSASGYKKIFSIKNIFNNSYFCYSLS